MARWESSTVRRIGLALGVVSITIVVLAAGGFVPSTWLPHLPAEVLGAIPILNAIVSLLAIGSISLGWRAIRRGNVERHRRLMMTSLGLFLTFLLAYLYRVILLGPTHFEGPTILRTFVFWPLLAVHILLAMAAIPLVYYALGLALTRSIPELRQSPHRRIGRMAASLWLISFTLGLAVFALLYLWP